MLSICGLTIPFIEHDDGVRVNMAESQTRQAIGLTTAEEPLIKTGFEDLYTEYTLFLYKAKDDGEVIFEGTPLLPYLVVRYDCGDIEFIPVMYRNVDGFDITVYPKVKEGRFKQDSILAASIHFRNGNLALGKNLLSIFYTYKGWNFEDAIVVSENATKKMIARKFYSDKLHVKDGEALLSLTDNSSSYYPIRKYASEVEKNDVLFKILRAKLRSVKDVFSEAKVIRAPQSGKFYWYLTIGEFGDTKYVPYLKFLKKYQVMKTSQEEIIIHRLLKYYPEAEVLKLVEPFISTSKVVPIYEDKKLDGLLIDYSILKDEPLKLGSKLANRHGNKGTISKILVDKEVIYTEKGEEIDIVLGPLGTISRMNVGQLFEMHLNRSVENFVKHKLFSKGDPKENLVEFISMVDKLPNKQYTKKTKQMLDSLSKRELQRLYNEIQKNGLQIIQPPFHSITYEDLRKIMAYTGTKEKETVIIDGERVQASVGKIYFYRLLHEPEKKVFSRNVGRYTTKINQPVSGRKNKGGHRLGEMETWTLVAYEAYNILKEYLSIKSDNVTERQRFLRALIKNTQDFYTPRTLETTSLEVFRDLLKGLGLNMKIEDDNGGED